MPTNCFKVINLKEDILPLCLMSFLVLVFLHNGLFPLAGSQVLSSQYTDGRSEFYPNQSFGFGALSEGIIPLWNPYVFSGMPYFATIKNGIFYPLNFTYDTIEHTMEPKAFLKESGRILKDDGLIVIATPDIGNWLGNRKFQYKPLEHLYFNIDTISKMLRDAGMEAIAYREMKVNRSLRFHIERLKYFFRRSSSVLNTIESLLKTARLLEISFFIPDGQMVVYAKKVVK